MEEHVNTASRPSELRITDMRTVTIGPSTIIRLDTNQDVYGLGEVRDGASKPTPLPSRRVFWARIPATSTRSSERSASSVTTPGRLAASAP